MTPLPGLITDLGWSMINDVPPVLREDPTIRAILHCYARETELRRERIDQVRREVFPQHATEVGIIIWEAALAIVPSADLTLEERRENVLGLLRSIRNAGRGSDWEAALTRIAGEGWIVEEHEPENPGGPGPAAYTVRVLLPFPATSGRYQFVTALLREMTPYNVSLVVGYAGGFILDADQLDAGLLG